MIEDLVFKGKNLKECLSKAANFFGVKQEILKYQREDEAPQGEVWIKLTENPLLAQRDSGEADSAIPTGHTYDGNVSGNTYPSGEFETTRHQKRTPRQNTPQGKQHGRQSTRQHSGKRQQQSTGRSQQQQRSGGRRNQQRSRGHESRQRDRRPARSGGRQFKQQRPPQQDTNWKPADIDTSSLTDAEREMYQFVADILEKMGLQTDLHFKQYDDRFVLNIDGPDRPLLLNRKGEPLISIQYLVNKVFIGRNEAQKPAYVDSMGYRTARDEELQEIALANAEKVRRSGKEYSLSPMNPYERRQVHVALKNEKGVSTISKGSGYIKRVSIVPAE